MERAKQAPLCEYVGKDGRTCSFPKEVHDTNQCVGVPEFGGHEFVPPAEEVETSEVQVELQFP